MTETLGERLPDAMKRIGHFLGSDQTQKVKSEFVADIMAIFAAVSSQAADNERHEKYDRACTIMWNALGSDKADLQNDVFTLAAAELDRLRDAVAYLRANVKPPAPDHPAWCWPDVWKEFERRVSG
jgi:hypothetical protein